MIRHHYIVAYDICEPSRLRKVHKICSAFGFPIQYSLFGCQLSAKQLASLKAQLTETIRAKEDQIIFLKVKKVTDRNDSNQIPGIESLGRKIRWGPTRAIII